MIAVMSKRKTTKKRDSGNLNPQFPVRMPQVMRDSIEQLATRNVQSATELVRAAVREYLERHGMWPPPAPRDDASTQRRDS